MLVNAVFGRNIYEPLNESLNFHQKLQVDEQTYFSNIELPRLRCVIKRFWVSLHRDSVVFRSDTVLCNATYFNILDLWIFVTF